MRSWRKKSGSLYCHQLSLFSRGRNHIVDEKLLTQSHKAVQRTQINSRSAKSLFSERHTQIYSVLLWDFSRRQWRGMRVYMWINDIDKCFFYPAHNGHPKSVFIPSLRSVPSSLVSSCFPRRWHSHYPRKCFMLMLPAEARPRQLTFIMGAARACVFIHHSVLTLEHAPRTQCTCGICCE